MSLVGVVSLQKLYTFSRNYHGGVRIRGRARHTAGGKGPVKSCPGKNIKVCESLFPVVGVTGFSKDESRCSPSISLLLRLVL